MSANTMMNILKNVGYTSYNNPEYYNEIFYNDSTFIESILKKYVVLTNNEFSFKDYSSTNITGEFEVDGVTYNNPIVYEFRITVKRGVDNYIYMIPVFLDKNYQFRYLITPVISVKQSVKHIYGPYEYDGDNYYYYYDLSRFIGETDLFTSSFVKGLIEF